MLFGVLGPLAVRRPDGQVLEITADRQRKLLALLLLHGNDWVSQQDAVAVLWPDGAPAAAESNLRTYVHHLRQLLPRTEEGTPRINGREGAHRLNVAPAETDLGLFEDLVAKGGAALGAGEATAAVERLTSALNLWRGDPFDPLDPALTKARTAELETLRWVARDTLADALLRADRPADAVSLLWPLSDLVPLREDTWRRLITALDLDGHRDQALAVYEQFLQAQQQAGQEQSPRMSLVHRQLLGQDDDQTVRLRAGQAGLPLTTGRRLAPSQPLPPQAPAQAPRQAMAPPLSAAPGQGVPPVARTRRFRPLAVLSVVALLVAVVLVGGVGYERWSNRAKPVQPSQTESATTTAAATTSPLPDGVSPRRAVPAQPEVGTPPRLLFGVGDQADVASRSELVRNHKANMLTTRYAGGAGQDVARLATWRNSVVPQAYGSGHALHLVISDASKDTEFTSSAGPVCGRPYALSPELLADVELLATAFAGQPDGPPLFVTLFDGVQGYACTKGAFRPDARTQAYYEALSDRFLQAREVFLRIAPNALVSLGWDSALASYDDSTVGGGISMIHHFGQLIRWSDFATASAIRPDGNVAHVRAAVAVLGQYAPVLLSYGPSAAFDQDVAAMLADDFVGQAVGDGLFALTFCGTAATQAGKSPVSEALTRYGRSAR